MEPDCNSAYDRSTDVSVEDEEESQEEQLSNSLKNFNHNEEVRSKFSDAMDAVQSEDNGLMWETSSSRCSMSQASETSATSGVYSMENSYIDSPAGKIMPLMDEGKIAQGTGSNSPDQTPLSPNQKCKKFDYSGRQMQDKAEERELDPANPQSWPYQVQPSKIKDYLVQITQEVVPSLPEEKENSLKKKGELPLEGTVRARILQITAVLEERHKKIFRRVDRKDVPPPPPPPVIKKPREQPKIFSRQGISVSLRHVEREAKDKNKKEILRYNLKHVQTNIPKSGVSVPYDKDEKKPRRSFLSETQNKRSEKLPFNSSSIADKANKVDTEPNPPTSQPSVSEEASFAPSDHWAMEKKEDHSLLWNTANIMSEKLSNFLAETEKEKLQHHLPMTTGVDGISVESGSMSEMETTQPCALVSPEPLFYSKQTESQSESTITALSEPATQDVQYPNNLAAKQHEPPQSDLAKTPDQDIQPHLSQLEIKDATLLHSVEETGKQDKPPFSLAATEFMPEHAESPHSVPDTEQQEIRQMEMGYSKKEEIQEQLTTVLQTESEHQQLVHAVKESEAREMETVPEFPSTASRTEAQESQYYPYKEASALLQSSYFMNEAEKKEEQLQSSLVEEAVQAQLPVTSPLEPEHTEESHLRDEIENQTAEIEFQCPDSSLPILDAEREEIHQHSSAVAEPESEHPVISELIKAPLRSKHSKLSHPTGKEASLDAPAAALDSSEQLLAISSLHIENVEKQESQLYLPVSAMPLSEQPTSILPYQNEQMEKQENLPYFSETVVSEEASRSAAFQTTDVREVEIQPYSHTKVPSEELVSVSRESDGAVEERKTTPSDSPLPAESLPEASVPSQEVAKLENQVSSLINAKLYPKDQDVTCLCGDENQREDQFHLLATSPLELEHSVESECKEAREQNIGHNSSISSHLEETIASHSIHERDEKDMHPDTSFTEPSSPDSSYPICVPEEQERVQSETEQTAQQLPTTVLQVESDILNWVEEMEIDGSQALLPATGLGLPQSVCVMETQGDHSISTRAADLDTGSFSTLPIANGIFKQDTPELDSEHMTKQGIQAVGTELEPDYPQVLPSVCESGKHINIQSTEKGNLHSESSVAPQSEAEHAISPEKEREEAEQYLSIIPVLGLRSPTAGPETQESQSYLPGTLNETAKPSPEISLSLQINDQAVSAASMPNSMPPSEQSNLLSPALKEKAEIEESQFLIPEVPKMVPEESLPIAPFLTGEARKGPPYPPMDTQIVPEESKAILEDVASEAVKEMALPSLPVSAEHLFRQTVALYAVDGDKHDDSHSLSIEESVHLAAEKVGMQKDHFLATAQSETRNQDIEPYCPVTSQSEQEDLSLFNSTEEIMKQETTLQSAHIHQELLYHGEERDNQERILLETELSKVQNSSLKSPILQQTSEHLNSLPSVKELEVEGTPLFSSVTAQDSSQLAGESGIQECQGYLPTTVEVDSGVSVLSEFMDKAKKPEIQLEAMQLECRQSVSLTEERGRKQHYPLVTAPLDLGHLDLSSSTEAQLYSSEAPNQTLELPPSVSPLHPEKIEKQEVNSHSPVVSMSSQLGQSNSILLDLAEKQETQPSTPEIENVMPEEPLSIAAFLLSEAKEIQTSFYLTKAKENVEAQPPFEEAKLLAEINDSAGPPATDVSIEKESPLAHFALEPFSSKPQTEVTDQDKREHIPDSPATPNLIRNEPYNAVLSEPVNDICTRNLHSSADSDTSANKAITICMEDLPKTEEITCLSSGDQTMKEPEHYLQKEREIKHEQQREEAVSAAELVHGKDTSGISKSFQAVRTYAAPLTSSVDKEENKHMPERSDFTVKSLKIKTFHEAEDMVSHEPSVCKLNTAIPEILKEGNHKDKGNESKGFVEGINDQGNIEAEKETFVCLENDDDGILKEVGTDNFGMRALIEDRSFTETGKKQSTERTQRLFDVTEEKFEEATSLPASSKDILEFSLLGRDLDETFQGTAKKENTKTTEEDTSKISNKDELTDSLRKNNKDTEEEFNTEKDTSFQSSQVPLPVTTVNPELLKGPSALAFLYEDLYEEAMGELKKDSCKPPFVDEMENTNVPFDGRHQIRDDGTGIYFEKDIHKDDISNNLEEPQKEQVIKDQPIHEQVLHQSGFSQDIYEPNEKEHEVVHILAKAFDETELLSPRGIVTGINDALIEGPAEIMSDIKVVTCQPTHALPFRSRFFTSGASNDERSQSREEGSLSPETNQMLPEETSDEESSPILDYAATVYQEEASIQEEAFTPEEAFTQDGSKDTAFLAVDQNQQSEETEIHEADKYAVAKPVKESTQFHETFQHIDTHLQSEGHPESQFISALEPEAQDTHDLNHEHFPCWDTEGQALEERLGEHIPDDFATQTNSLASQQLAGLEAISDKTFGELDYSLLSHDFDTYPLYSIKEEEYSDVDEDLAELMGYEMVTQDDVFQEETSSEVAREELLFNERKSLDRISDTYEFVSEREANTYAEEEGFELMGPEKLPKNLPESEIWQKETEEAQLDTYCYQCKCLISADNKLFGDHKEHNVTNLETAATELKGQLDGFLDVLQERSLKIEGFVGEIEALFNSLEENCKEKEQLLEEQNESIIKTVIEHHDKKAQSFEEIKNTKMEYLYEQMVTFQEYIDTAKDSLEAIIKETEEMDDFVFLRSAEEINKRILSAVENILILEKMPAAFSLFEHYASSSANGDQTLKHMPVPNTPKLQPQDPNSATGTSIAVYWTVNEDDVIDFFQVYCVEEHPESKEQSGLVEEYRVTVKESNCVLEDLEPGHCYSVWVMAVNYTGCSFPSNKSTFRTAPPTPVIQAADCSVCWNTATIRWSTGNPEATDSFTLEYCRQYSPEGEGLRSLAGIKRPELKVNLAPNINYFFYVRAVNLFGTSEQSEAALISTKGTRFHIMKETAHLALQVSPNGTMICLPEETKVTGISPVLGELLAARGWHYWETTVTGCKAYRVGICYPAQPQDSALGQNKTSWCLHCCSTASFVYKALHNGEMSEVNVTEQLVRIGILLDFDAGRLLFFNAERGQVLFSIRQKFTSAVHPAFVLEQPGVLNLHTGMELPEFVKYS
ncbi:cardiomyopathy-associated protein 5 [Hemicordylus capensis]|uniref:cardiomyopathy-associated protein 5 n=1 Tax=Hemicordylus capensis TaxID=884348 RepID=UPI002303C703|nr:cardiomyopathy-associated protein 5 [Hemicordylus capensis]